MALYLNSFLDRQGDEFDVGRPERLFGSLDHLHPAVGTLPHDKRLRRGFERGLWVVGIQGVPLLAPPLRNHPIRQDDDVPIAGLPTNDNPSEAIRLGL
jgi:hypothetical protein